MSKLTDALRERYPTASRKIIQKAAHSLLWDSSQIKARCKAHEILGLGEWTYY